LKKVLLQGIFFILFGHYSFGQISLFGQAYGGGAHNEGEVFQLCEKAGSWSYRDLYDFPSCASNSSPTYCSCEGQGTLFLASNKILYGVGDNGGSHWQGMIFSENPATGTYTDLYSVSNSPYLNYFMQPVPGGKLFGLGTYGGASGNGNVFTWNYNTNTYSDLHDFAGQPNDGESPSQSTLLWYRDTLYGITSAGGNLLGSCNNGYGTLFSLDTNGVRFKILFNFANGCTGSPNTGSYPQGSIAEAAGPSGHPCIYGVCYADGANGAYIGSIWQYDLSTYTYSDIHDFTGSTSGDGAEPSGGLILASDGNLYGTCPAGGNSNSNGGFGTYSTGYGTLFKINPSTHAFSVVHTFQGGTTDGDFPSGSVIQASDGNLYGMCEFGGTGGSGDGIAYQFVIASSTFNVIYNFASPNVYEPVWNNFAASTTSLCDVLPISLLSFSGNYSMNTRSTDLAWATETEISNHYFFIERSTDGINWQTIDTTAGSGNTSSTKYYTTIDPHPPVGTNYYKLIQEDFDGHKQTCNVIPVFVPSPKVTTLYPNPVSGTLNIDGDNLQSILIYNMLGQTIWAGNATDSKISVDVSSFPNGLYIVQTTDKTGNTTMLKFTKQNTGQVR